MVGEILTADYLDLRQNKESNHRGAVCYQTERGEMIVSVSRRTDVPKLYAEWFFNRLKEGYVYVRNPMNFRQVSKIALDREAVDCFVFWSKDPAPMLLKLSILEEAGYPFYFQFTLTPYGRDMEVNLKNKEELVRTFKNLSNIIGAKRVIWRYDPIVLNHKYTIEYHREHFKSLCEHLSGYTDVCEISYVDIYTKLKNVASQGIIRPITDEEMFELTKDLVEIGGHYNMQIRVCCEEKLVQELHIPKANCIDQELIEEFIGNKIKVKKISGQRIGCGCLGSVDIGIYNTCNNGCKYCYANLSLDSANENYLKHNPFGEMLLGEIMLGDKVTERSS